MNPFTLFKWVKEIKYFKVFTSDCLEKTSLKVHWFPVKDQREKSSETQEFLDLYRQDLLKSFQYKGKVLGGSGERQQNT